MLTVVLATHNGAETLSVTLDAFTMLDVPENGWKLIVVDNASTDKTLDILELYRNNLPLKVVFHSKRGKNLCLNVAVPYFEGDLIIFTDDDVVPMKGWLTSYADLATQHPDVAVFGGRILPRWPGSVPVEILESIPLAPAFAIHPENILDGLCSPDQIWGPNMAVRHEVFLRGYRFNESVGPTSGNYIMGSETEFTRRLGKDGYKFWFSNTITVEHLILEHQFTLSWLFGRAKRFGKGEKFIMLSEEPCDNVVYIMGLPRWLILSLTKDIIKLFVSFIQMNKKRFVSLMWKITEDFYSYHAL